MSSYEPSYSTKSKIYDYLESEFLNAEKQTLTLIVNYYYKKYGNGAGNYLMNTYYSWQKGRTRISSQTFGRIIEFMPKFLSEEKRFHILKEEVHNYFDKIRKGIPNQVLKFSEVNELFEHVQKELLGFGRKDLQWFVGNNIFTDDQIEHFLNICRYVLNEKLISSHRQVANDLILIKNKINHFNVKFKIATYKIKFFNRDVSLNDNGNLDYDYSQLVKLDFKLNESLSRFGERYFLDELMKVSFTERSIEHNLLLKGSDIDLFLSHYLELKKQNDNQIVMKSEYEGEGGTLTLNLEYYPNAFSYQQILTSILKVIAILGLACLIIVLVPIFKGNGGAFAVISLILWLTYLLPALIKEFKKMKLSINQIKQNG